ncbi:hypothetical protein EON63_18330 [archaeon]|nr:MAG: hypothetical protein EON63_18330 [archaeon]
MEWHTHVDIHTHTHTHTHTGIILSWAIPGQGGNGHVNEQSNAYLINTLSGLGYQYDAQLSERGRKEAEMFWFRSSFMVFHRRAP